MLGEMYFEVKCYNTFNLLQTVRKREREEREGGRGKGRGESKRLGNEWILKG